MRRVWEREKGTASTWSGHLCQHTFHFTLELLPNNHYILNVTLTHLLQPRVSFENRKTKECAIYPFCSTPKWMRPDLRKKLWFFFLHMFVILTHTCLQMRSKNLFKEHFHVWTPCLSTSLSFEWQCQRKIIQAQTIHFKMKNEPTVLCDTHIDICSIVSCDFHVTFAICSSSTFPVPFRPLCNPIVSHLLGGFGCEK